MGNASNHHIRRAVSTPFGQRHRHKAIIGTRTRVGAMKPPPLACPTVNTGPQRMRQSVTSSLPRRRHKHLRRHRLAGGHGDQFGGAGLDHAFQPGHEFLALEA